jgi:uncharacterized protein (TIGR03067 family)
MSIGANVEEAQASQSRADFTAGRYIIKVRYGVPGQYRYTKGEEFEVKASSTTQSEITITLHKVVAGNYESHPISGSAFGEVQGDRSPVKTEEQSNRPNKIRVFLEQNGGLDWVGKVVETGGRNTVPVGTMEASLRNPVDGALLEKQFGKPISTVKDTFGGNLGKPGLLGVPVNGERWEYGPVAVFISKGQILDYYEFPDNASVPDKAEVEQPKADATKKELDKFQGKWLLVDSEIDGHRSGERVVNALEQSLAVKGDRFTATIFEGQSKAKGNVLDESKSGGTLKINATPDPKEVDFAYDSGPMAKKTRKGIYRWEDERLILCVGGDGGVRPKEFKTGTKAGGVTLKTFKKR